MGKKVLSVLLTIMFFILYLNSSIFGKVENQNNDFSFSVLCYHNVKEIITNEYDVSLDNFDRQMKYLFENHFTSLFATEVVELLKGNVQKENPEFLKKNSKLIALTFDDGNDGVHLLADKVLSKYGLKATLYIYPSIIFQKEERKYKHYMTFNQMKELLKTANYEIGCHSYYHPYMTKEDENGLILNTIKAKETLTKQIGIEPKTFAYPFGLYNDQVIKYVKNAGFIGAFTIDKKYITRKTELYKIPRFMITNCTSFEKFVEIVNTK